MGPVGGFKKPGLALQIRTSSIGREWNPIQERIDSCASGLQLGDSAWAKGRTHRLRWTRRPGVVGALISFEPMHLINAPVAP
jgi:hypothetical protein